MRTLTLSPQRQHLDYDIGGQQEGADLAAVIRERLDPAGGNGLPDLDYLADMLARDHPGHDRSAMIRHAQLSRDPDRETVPTSVLVEQALSILAIPGRRDLSPESGPTTGQVLQ